MLNLAKLSRSILPALLLPLVSIGCKASSNQDGGLDANQINDGAPPNDGGVNNDGAVGEDGGQEDVGGGLDAAFDAGVDVATRPLNGSAMMMTSDDSRLLVLNRRAGGNDQSSAVRLEKYTVDLANNAMTLEATAELPGARQLIIGPTDETAYVAAGNTIFKFIDLSTNGLTQGPTATSGGEPRGIALSPDGTQLYVANWADGTVTQINASNMVTIRSIDLNAALAQSGRLGTVAPRPGLAHPFAIAITNDGDGDFNDETAYVTEFFSQTSTETIANNDAAFDIGRQGIVYPINLATGTVGSLISIAPIDDTGFVDTNAVATGCFPNQLNAATINSGRLYVTGICASPRGPTGPVFDGAGVLNPANFKTEVHAAVWTIDLATNREDPSRRVLLTREFQDLYDTGAVPDDGANRRIPLIPNDIAFVPTLPVAYLTAYGSDAVFRIEYAGDGSLVRVGATTANFINLAPNGQPAGRLPYGLAISSDGTKSLVVNEFTRNVSFISFATQNVVSAVDLTDAAPGGLEADINTGRRFFVTGVGRWSFRGQSWNSCEACHPDGLTDNVTWFFARGPRQTTSLDGTYDADGTTRRVLNWTAIFDEVHDFELNTRGNSGGVGAIVHANSSPPVGADRIHFDGSTPVPAGNQPTATPQNGLNGSTISLMPGGATLPNTVLEDWNRIDTYVRSILAPRAPTNLNTADVDAGGQLFADNNCAACHGGPLWTISRVFYTPDEANNNPTTGSLRLTDYIAPTQFPPALNPPSSAAGRMAPLRFTNADPAVVAANDQINCILRAVGTFPAVLDGMQTGISPAGVRVREVRTNMSTPAQGASGFNPPSLLGMASGAPYFHAGNARTLEEALGDPAFQAHAAALSANFPGVGNRDQLIAELAQFLLSIDENTAFSPIPDLGYNPDLCP